MSDNASIEFQQTAKKILESTNIYYFQNLFGLSNPSTYSSEEMFHAVVRAGLRRLALRFHPDKNPKMKLLAEEVMKKLGNVSRHFMGGEELYANTNPLYTNLESFTDIELLEYIEALIEPYHKSRSLPLELSHALPNLVEEAKKRVLKDKRFMDTETSTGKRLLYLAARWADNSLFLWLHAQGDNPLLSTGYLSPLHVLITSNKQETLACLIAMYGDAEFKKICLDTILNFKEEGAAYPAILTYFVNYLINNQADIPISALHNNPYLIQTVLGENFSAEERFTFIMKNIKEYSGLYYLLTPKQQIEPFAVLSQYNKLNMESFVPYLFFCGLQSKGLSPYFSKALSDKFPHIESWAKRLDQESPGAIFFNSLFFASFSKEFQILAFGSLAVCSLALGLIFLGAAYTPGAPVVFAIGTALALCASIFCIYQHIRTYIEKVKINKILTENNFFKQTPGADTTSASVDNPMTSDGGRGVEVTGDASDDSDDPDELWMSMV